MKTNKILKIEGTMLDKQQLENHLEKLAASHNLTTKSQKETYPVPHLMENFQIIEEVYNLLNEHIKIGISIDPAGEWLLDNFYIIEETVKQIQKELTIKKYTNFIGISEGSFKGFARIYVLSAQIIAYTENKIVRENLEDYLLAYQRKKTLSMDEIWNIGTFLQIAIIENLAQIALKIYSAQMQKYKAENIVQRIIENKAKTDSNISIKKNKIKESAIKDMRYPFIEYMSYILKRYGKKGYPYLQVLEETVEMTGNSVGEIIKKEHFDIALRKVLIGNSIISIKEIQRINFLEIFEKINGVEDILKKDPANVYEKMDYKTKEYYRNKIKEIGQKSKMSEIYIAKKILELANKEHQDEKKRHIGYYLIDEGINDLYKKLGYVAKKQIKSKKKVEIYLLTVYGITILLSLIFSMYINYNVQNVFISVISFLVFFIPISEIVIQITQYILSKIIKPKLIPKLDFQDGIDKEHTSLIIIPTIIKSKEKVKELARNLEVYYLANKSKNLYFAILGDCSQSNKKDEEFDQEVIKEGLKQVEILNDRYKKDIQDEEQIPIFHFFYRNREWNEKEKSFLGWERKRGMINQCNEYLLGNIKNPFRVNTIENIKEKTIPNLKYIITLDADTGLILDTVAPLVGAMAHILNKPEIDNKKNIVIKGHALIQPRIGINLDISFKNLFTKIFAGAGGIDSYSNAISDIYEDNFDEGIFTGKGIYDLKVFSQVLNNAIPENTVLSHDLLEGSYLRCGLASDIMLMDGYPGNYSSFMNRLSRWIRGDWQIILWLKRNIKIKDKKIKNPLNGLSKYKIFDNLRRSLIEISIFVAILFCVFIKFIKNIKIYPFIIVLLISLLNPFILEFINHVIFKKEGEQKQKTFTPCISGLKGVILRTIITLGCFPYKAYVSIKAILKTLYRITISHKHLLEWTTSEEAERLSKTSLISYNTQMLSNIIIAIATFIVGFYLKSIFTIILGIIWIITPTLMWYISRPTKRLEKIQTLKQDEKQFLLDVAKRTWLFFETFLTEENNYLITDNYQEDRKEKIVKRTSSTNIGLSTLAVISAYDFNFIKFEKCIELLEKILSTILSLPKWNGHLYNWYQILNKEPLFPRYVSTVDSGNFVGYMLTLKGFLEEEIEKSEEINLKERLNVLKEQVEKIIEDTDFSYLYNKKHQLFSIGYDVEENKLTDSYYDLLASEARQTSFVAIVKKDVPAKHWNSLSRTLTVVGKYKGLISWSGTSFEYLMPNINIPKYPGSMLEESCHFMIMSQKEYAKKLGIPWGISEAAFNVKDLHGNYQYKAFGIPWLGLKRGLADEIVVAPYGSILSVSDIPKDVIENLKILQNYGMYDKFGFYESIDFTPERVEKGNKAGIVKTYMAHHQGLILISINNLFGDNIMQKRFSKNSNVEATKILLQERMPETSIITKENKEKVEKLKIKDYENYTQNIFTKIENGLIRSNVISNENYMVAMDQRGRGISKYKDIYINRFKATDDYAQGIFFYIKNIKDKTIWGSSAVEKDFIDNQYKVTFSPDKDKIEKNIGNIKTKIETTIAQNEPVELRRLTVENIGNVEEILEITTYFEPVLSKKEQEYAHPAFNNLFLIFNFDEKTNSLKVERKIRNTNERKVYMQVSLNLENENIGEMEYEISKEKFYGRGNLDIPNMIKNSLPFSKRIGLVTQGIVALKRTIKIKPQESINLDLIISVGEEKDKVEQNLRNFQIAENVKREFALARARVEAENRYLGVKGKEIEEYQKILSYIIFKNPIKQVQLKNVQLKKYSQSELWKYGISGDFPIILVNLKTVNELEVVKEILKAYEFFRAKKVDVEIVFMDEEKHSYENYVREEIENSILNRQMGYLKNIRGGLFILSKQEIDKNDYELLKFVSTIIIDCSKGSISNIIKELEEEYIEQRKVIGENPKSIIVEEELENNPKVELKYDNSYGGFTENGKEYHIRQNKENRLPTVWSHVIANKKFGTIITDSMGGYSFYKNSRLNRTSTWHNDSTLDIPSEIIYLKDEENNKSWSLGLNPKPDNQEYNIIYGFGYAQYLHKSNGIEQILDVFIPEEDSVKINILTLKNLTPNRKKVKIIYYAKLTMGEDELKSKYNISLNFDENNNILCAKNLYSDKVFNDIVYTSSSEKIKSFTGDKDFFIGLGGIQNPDALNKISLNNEQSIGKQPIICYEVEVEIESFSSKQVSMLLGAEESIIDCKNIAYKYSKVQNCKQELIKVKNSWEEIIGRLQVSTPLESMNIILNGWLIYQTISSRLLAKSGFYQSGGAFGFRDQLQDTLGLKYLDNDILKKQIIINSKHQFLEGDVEHWWHEDTQKGIRTRFSDDLLWMVYATCKYIDFTGDKSILDIKTQYLKGNLLKEGQDDCYDKFETSEIEEELYKHCIRAINRSLDFGENGLPKIGSGDWNDGFSTVGNKGKGESVWLGFFLYQILDEFIPICRERNDEEIVQKYEQKKLELKKALNTNGWDGRWFKRAFMDNGSILGSMENEECRIDSIAQSWSVISNAGDNDKKYIAMESLENHLVDKENGIIKLLDPPFEKGKLEPGYIKAYLPGVRENGGQYTHVCCC